MGVEWSANFAVSFESGILTKLNEPFVRPLPGRLTFVFVVMVVPRIVRQHVFLGEPKFKF